MAKYGKYRSMQELLEAKQGGVMVNRMLEGVVENIQKIRKELKKPKSQRWSRWIIDNELRHDLVSLNKVIKQLKRNAKLN
jgi:hypothetical protein|tara:strand:+ start:1637 stop:1876 length:240 start_codon:yes stop_codon:yes gene_type:complete